MTYNYTTGVTEFGACPYIGHYNTTHAVRVCYIRLPNNVSLLNEFRCGPLNWEDPLCGKCKDGYGIALYSYTLQCSKCWGHSYGWSLYYFLELSNNCDILSGGDLPHNSHLLPTECTCVHESNFSVHNTTEHTLPHVHWEWSHRIPYVALKVLLVLCGIWSLDFFRSVIM